MGFTPVHIRLRFEHGASADVYRWCHASGNVSDMASANARHSAAINGATAANPNVAVGAIPAEAEMAAEKRVSLRSFIIDWPRGFKTSITLRNVPPRATQFNRWYCEYAFREIRKVEVASLQLETLRNRMGGAYKMHKMKCIGY
jgi:hypothetical protein